MLRKLIAAVGLGAHGLGQPGADVALAGLVAALFLIDAQARHDLRQEGAIGFDLTSVDGLPAQPGFLHDVFGLRHRAEHAVGDGKQEAALGLEALGGGGLAHASVCFRVASAFSYGVGSESQR